VAFGLQQQQSALNVESRRLAFQLLNYVRNGVLPIDQGGEQANKAPLKKVVAGFMEEEDKVRRHYLNAEMTFKPGFPNHMNLVLPRFGGQFLTWLLGGLLMKPFLLHR
jgi:hypothetical protein